MCARVPELSGGWVGSLRAREGGCGAWVRTSELDLDLLARRAAPGRSRPRGARSAGRGRRPPPHPTVMSVGIGLIAMGQGLAGHGPALGPASVASKGSGRTIAAAWPQQQHLKARERFCSG